jgi:hypothetical protein
LESPRNEETRTLPRKTWKRTVEEEAIECGKTCSEIKRRGWRHFGSDDDDDDDDDGYDDKNHVKHITFAHNHYTVIEGNLGQLFI